MKLTFPFSFALLFSLTGLAQAATVWSLSDPNVTAVNFTQPAPGMGHEVAPGIILNRDNDAASTIQLRKEYSVS